MGMPQESQSLTLSRIKRKLPKDGKNGSSKKRHSMLQNLISSNPLSTDDLSIETKVLL